MSLICHYALFDLLPIIRVQALEQRAWFHIGHRSEEESRDEEDDAAHQLV
jgi:hypothetical protein